jgi:hypothetical protein
MRETSASQLELKQGVEYGPWPESLGSSMARVEVHVVEYAMSPASDIDAFPQTRIKFSSLCLSMIVLRKRLTLFFSVRMVPDRPGSDGVEVPSSRF